MYLLYRLHRAWVIVLCSSVLLTQANLIAQSNSSDKNLYNAHRARQAGDALYDKSQYGKAQEAYQKALSLQPNDWQARYNLANSLYEQSKYDAAIPLLSEAARLTTRPNDRADALHNLGNAYFKRDKWAEAVKAYQQSLRYRPGDPDTKQNLQMARQRLDEQQKKEQEKQKKQPPQDQQQPQPDQQPQPNQQPDPQPSGQQQQTLDNIANEDRKTRQRYQQRRAIDSNKKNINEW
jgi:Ca-activated chloride channel homolog